MPCTVCQGQLTVALPVWDGDIGTVDDRPCPVCRPWREGFGGLFGRTTRGRSVLIAPIPVNHKEEQ